MPLLQSANMDVEIVKKQRYFSLFDILQNFEIGLIVWKIYNRNSTKITVFEHFGYSQQTLASISFVYFMAKSVTG